MYSLNQRIQMAQAKSQSYKAVGDVKRESQYQAYVESLKSTKSTLVGYTDDGMAIFSNVLFD